MDINEIIISTLGEVVGIDSSERGFRENLALLKLGQLCSVDRHINDIARIAKNIEEESYYFLFQTDDYFHFGKILDIDIYYYHFDFSLKRRHPDMADFLIRLSKKDYTKLVHTLYIYRSKYGSSVSIFQFGRMWTTTKLWHFRGVILKHNSESLEELKNLGVGLLLMLGKEHETP